MDKSARRLGATVVFLLLGIFSMVGASTYAQFVAKSDTEMRLERLERKAVAVDKFLDAIAEELGILKD